MTRDDNTHTHIHCTEYFYIVPWMLDLCTTYLVPFPQGQLYPFHQDSCTLSVRTAVPFPPGQLYPFHQDSCILSIRTVVRPSFMGIEFGFGIVLDLVLFANCTNAEPKSNRSTVFYGNMGGLQRFKLRVCIFLAVGFQKF